MGGVPDLLVVQAHQNVARLHAGLGGGTRSNLLDPHPTLVLTALTRGYISHRNIQPGRAIVRGAVQRQIVLVLVFVRQLAERDCDFPLLAVADDGQRLAGAGLGRTHQRRQIGAVVHRLAGVGHDDIASIQPGPGGGTVRAHIGHQRAARLLQIERARQVLRDLLQADAHPAPGYPPVGLELGDHVHRYIGRDGERQPHVTAAAAENLGIDAHQLAVEIEQWPAGVAGIDWHVGLDERHVGIIRQRAAQGADDAFGSSALQSERRADGEHPLADLETVGVADGHGR